MMTYKDPTKPVEERVRDLIARMTLEEKAAQLSCAMPTEADAMRETLGNGIGTLSFLNASMSGDIDEDRATLREMQRFLVEETRLGIPALIHNEGIAGLQIPAATTFQQPLGMAATWEPELARSMGELERDQLVAFGIHALHSPLFDLGRDPRWGRISETYGEDPYLVAQMGSAYVEGVQAGDKVMATAKHFVGYGNAEGGRNGGEMQLGTRTLLDTFCWPFEAAIQDAGVMAVMNGYGILNGEPIATSKALLTDLLRDELGFSGPVVSDYGSIGRADARYRTSASQRQTAVQALSAGIDVEQPTNVCFQHLPEAVRAGEIDEGVLDRALERILSVKFRLGLFENPYAQGDYIEEVRSSGAAALSREVAEKSIVLLKNEGGVLPLREGQTVALIGPSADAKTILFGGYSSVGSAGTNNRDFDRTENDKFLAMAYQATITEFKDSLKQQLGMEFDDEPSPEQKEIILGILKRNFAGGNTVYADAREFVDTLYPQCRSVRQVLTDELGEGRVLYAPGCGIRAAIPGGIEAALDCVRRADVVVAVLGGLESMVDEDATCGENRDNPNTDLEAAQRELMRAVMAEGKPVVSVLIDGRPLSVRDLDRGSDALLHAWLPGEYGADAIAAVLTGRCDPSGKLPVTMVRDASQIPLHYDRAQLFADPAVWSEYIDDELNRPLYPFGHGLSYTRFAYGDLEVQREVEAGGTLSLSFSVGNEGERAGDEIAQVYVRDRLSSVARPSMQLVAFARVPLQPGERKTVRVELSTSQLAFHDDRMRLVVEPGEMDLFVGASSEDIRLRGEFEITGDLLEVTRRVHTANVSAR